MSAGAHARWGQAIYVRVVCTSTSSSEKDKGVV
jgi:hypothetical protein